MDVKIIEVKKVDEAVVIAVEAVHNEVTYYWRL